ncbi:LacI family DNA-binding transcriptional regulator [Rubrobacter aplysinae]|uniref:LacI family DNA-binding transcriptional regulator n=1 Tax=Rubrobacter aplysinae TaxID=909625 RepID=UPI00064BBF0B|nr:LacI family DNA-binding transcriptional regulator [Rubrobacter aplysinae]
MGVNGESGGGRATLKKVAGVLGVSPSTVSNAYNRPDQLSPELRERVFETARRLGYSGPDPLGRSLRRQRAGTIGVLYTDRLSYAFRDPAAVLFLEGVSEATEEAGLGLLLIPGAPREKRDTEAVREAAVDGMIVFCMAEEDPLLAAALERRLPVVLVEQPPVEGLPAVVIDDEGASREAAEHLISLGHERLAVASMELSYQPEGGLAGVERQRAATYRPSLARLTGYETAVAAAGLSWEQTPVYECVGNSPEQGRAAAREILGQTPRPTAVLCMSDLLAAGVMQEARSQGLSVPEELSVVGFDDVPEAARAEPPLTTVNQPHVEKGRQAGRGLVSLLGGEPAPRTASLPTRLVVRSSTASPPGGNG